MGIVSHHDESENIVVNVITSQVEQTRRRVKRKVQEGVRKVRQIHISEESHLLLCGTHGTPYHTCLIFSVTHLRKAMVLCLFVGQYIVR
jgi:hypothetical protein